MGIIGKEVDIVYKDKREGDIKDSLADISLAKALINYEPTYLVDNGLNKTIEYFLK